MKIGRNEPCPCGSGKKYKHCCIASTSKPISDINEDIAQAIAMNPNLTFDEVQALADHKFAQRNTSGLDDFCGLTPNHMTNWLYEPLSQKEGVDISTPNYLTLSPVMRYLALIIDEAIAQGGAIKATAKGNLPAKLVKQASSLLPEFPVAVFDDDPSISSFQGSNEDKFMALNYARILAELCGILDFQAGRFHLTGSAQARYLEQGVNGFFLPMLEAATSHFNWAYFDGYPEEINLATFWLYMLWRLQAHSSAEQLTSEVITAFPALLGAITEKDYATPEQQLKAIIEARFLDRFLQFWGFIVMDPRIYIDGKRIDRKIEIQPLLTDTFRFSV